MKSDSRPAQNPSPVATRSHFAAQALLDDLRIIHMAETTRVNGTDVMVCRVCRPTGDLDERLAVATSGRELYPCPTLRVARRHVRSAR